MSTRLSGVRQILPKIGPPRLRGAVLVLPDMDPVAMSMPGKRCTRYDNCHFCGSKRPRRTESVEEHAPLLHHRVRPQPGEALPLEKILERLRTGAGSSVHHPHRGAGCEGIITQPVVDGMLQVEIANRRKKPLVEGVAWPEKQPQPPTYDRLPPPKVEQLEFPDIPCQLPLIGALGCQVLINDDRCHGSSDATAQPGCGGRILRTERELSVIELEEAYGTLLLVEWRACEQPALPVV